MKMLLAMAVIFSICLSFALQQKDPWKVPEKYEKIKNPVTADKASIKSGKEIYMNYCTGCHGINGKGAGARSERLTTEPADFTTAAFQNQSDGALLYKVYFGHHEMPGFKHVFPGHEGVSENSFGETRVPGDLINYLRSYVKK